MTNLTSKRDEAKLRKQAARDDETDATIIKVLMQSGNGRRWVYLRLFHSGIWHEDGVLDPQRMAWKAGLRNEGLRLQASIMQHCPDLYTRMWQENNKLVAEMNEAPANDEEEPIDG
jgi:hypothetical protein